MGENLIRRDDLQAVLFGAKLERCLNETHPEFVVELVAGLWPSLVQPTGLESLLALLCQLIDRWSVSGVGRRPGRCRAFDQAGFVPELGEHVFVVVTLEGKKRGDIGARQIAVALQQFENLKVSGGDAIRLAARAGLKPGASFWRWHTG